MTEVLKQQLALLDSQMKALLPTGSKVSEKWAEFVQAAREELLGEKPPVTQPAPVNAPTLEPAPVVHPERGIVNDDRS